MNSEKGTNTFLLGLSRKKMETKKITVKTIWKKTFCKKIRIKLEIQM